MLIGWAKRVISPPVIMDRLVCVFPGLTDLQLANLVTRTQRSQQFPTNLLALACSVVGAAGTAGNVFASWVERDRRSFAYGVAWVHQRHPRWILIFSTLFMSFLGMATRETYPVPCKSRPRSHIIAVSHFLAVNNNYS